MVPDLPNICKKIVFYKIFIQFHNTNLTRLSSGEIELMDWIITSCMQMRGKILQCLIDIQTILTLDIDRINYNLEIIPFSV